jgi:hypothetical protein
MTYQSHATVASLVADIERTGFGVIPGFVSASDLTRMRAFVARAAREAGGEYAGFIGPDSVAGSGLDELARSPHFRDLVKEVYERGTGQKAPSQEFYQLLRCLSGASARRHSYLFHYDSYVVTVLIPIEIPTSGMTGDLLMLPNTRRVRKSYAANVVDKIVLDNRLSQMLLRTLTTAHLIRPVRIRLVPGNAYFFWGYRSIHTNEPCDATRVRATALFHFANPHARPAAA